MNIYIDGLFFKQSGIGRYFESLLSALSNKNLTIYTCVNSHYRDKFESQFRSISNIIPIYVDYDHFSCRNFIIHSFFLKKINSNIDVFFFPHVNVPLLFPNNSILTIHDFRPFTNYWDRNIVKKFFVQFLYRRAMRSVKKIICISFDTQNRLGSIDNNSQKKSKCIYEFIDSKFSDINLSIRLIKSKYILFVGTRKSHKNLIIALKGFIKVCNTFPHCFVLAGQRDGGLNFDEVDSFILNNNLENRVIQFVSSTDEQIVSLYQHADLFVFPSLFEGFGLPPLEAVACGCPAILSDIPIFREIFGDSAMYFDPRSPEGLAALMTRLLTDEQARNDLLAKEKERLKLFDREKIVASYIDLFESVAK